MIFNINSTRGHTSSLLVFTKQTALWNMANRRMARGLDTSSTYLSRYQRKVIYNVLQLQNYFVDQPCKQGNAENNY